MRTFGSIFSRRFAIPPKILWKPFAMLYRLKTWVFSGGIVLQEALIIFFEVLKSDGKEECFSSFYHVSHFVPLLNFYTPWKRQKTFSKVFLVWNIFLLNQFIGVFSGYINGTLAWNGIKSLRMNGSKHSLLHPMIDGKIFFVTSYLHFLLHYHWYVVYCHIVWLCDPLLTAPWRKKNKIEMFVSTIT